MTEDLIHGNVVSLIAEDMIGTGTYGTTPTTPTMVWPGLTTSFNVDVVENYDETHHLAAHGDSSRLENLRNTKLGEDLSFSATIVPQKSQDWFLLEYIVGGAAAFADTVDSTSWIKELDSKYSVFSGIMLESYKADIPEHGKAVQALSGFAGNQEAPGTAPTSIVEATENTSNPVTWEDITSLKMDATATPSTAIDHCIGDISFGFTNTVLKRFHPESTLSTKMCGVKVVKRVMELSLTLTYVDQTFLSLVTGATKQNVLMTIKADGTDITTFTWKGLLWPSYIAKAEPDELIGDTITAIVDQPAFTYVTAAP